MKIEASPFINRLSELAHFKQKAEEIAKGKGEDLFFISPLGRGKTALLKELKESLFWGQEGVVPVYFSFSRDYIDLLDFAEEYLVSLLSQILFFDRKEQMATNKQTSFSFSGLQREAEKQGKSIIEEIIVTHQRNRKIKDDRKGIFNALSAPKRIAQATRRPVWMMIDHIQVVEDLKLTGKGVAGLWREAIASSWAPHLFSGEPPGYLLKNILPFLGPPDIAVMELAPLPAEEGEELGLLLEKYFQVKIAKDLSKSWFYYLERNPGFFTPILRDIRLEASGLESHQRFIEIYLKSLCQGELGRLFENRLYGHKGMDPFNGHLLLRILNQLLKSEGPFPLFDLQKSLELTSEKVHSLVRLLERTGVIREGFGNIGLENSRVTRDWVEVLIRKHLYQEDLGRIIEHLGQRIEKELSKLKEKEDEPFPTDGKALHFSLVLPINSSSELVAVRALEQMATYTDLDAVSVEKAKLSLIEACINASEHSQSFEKKIRVYFTVQPEAIEIVVEDRGQAFDPVQAQARTLREADPLSQKRGRGLALIKEMMDEVRFEKAEIGTRLYMVKKIQRESVKNNEKF